MKITREIALVFTEGEDPKYIGVGNGVWKFYKLQKLPRESVESLLGADTNTE